MATVTVPHPVIAPLPHTPRAQAWLPRREIASRSTPPSAPRRQRAKRGDGDRLRDEILTATEALLLRTGDVDAISVRAVAEAVGCTPPAIYLHFADKAELLVEVCGIRYRELAAFVQVACLGVEDPVESLRTSLRAYIQFGLEFPQHYRVLFMQPPVLDAAQWEELRMQGITGLDALVERCTRALETGRLRNTDAHLMAVGLWAMAHGIVSLRIVKPHFDWPDVERTVQHAVDTHINGLLS